MTVDDLRAAVSAGRAQGHEYLILTVRRDREPRGDRVRLWKGGPTGRFVGAERDERGVRVVVDVLLSDLERHL